MFFHNELDSLGHFDSLDYVIARDYIGGVRYFNNFDLIDLFLVFSANLNNISAISWRPVLVVEEAWSTRREPPTMVNFITCDCEWNASFL